MPREGAQTRSQGVVAYPNARGGASFHWPGSSRCDREIVPFRRQDGRCRRLPRPTWVPSTTAEPVGLVGRLLKHEADVAQLTPALDLEDDRIVRAELLQGGPQTREVAGRSAVERADDVAGE